MSERSKQQKANAKEKLGLTQVAAYHTNGPSETRIWQRENIRLQPQLI